MTRSRATGPLLPLSAIEALEHSENPILDMAEPGTALESLALILEELESGDVVDSKLVAWFRRALMKAPQLGSLDRAFGIAPADLSSAAKRAKHHYLGLAWEYLDDGVKAPTVLAKELASECERLELKWHEFQHLDFPRPEWHHVRTLVFRARRYGRLPGWQTLYQLLNFKNGRRN